MKTQTTLILSVLLFLNCTYAHAQYEQFFTVNEHSLLAVDLNTNANYDGTCQRFYDNQQLAWQMIIEKGSPVEMKSWQKNGKLSDSTIYINGFNLFKRFTFDRKGRVITEELLEMKSIAQSNDKKVKKMADKKRHTHSTVYEDCISFKSIYYTQKNTRHYSYETMYDLSKTLIVQYHKNGNVSDSTYYTNKSVNESKYITIKDGPRTEFDLAGNKSAELVFENNTLVKKTLFEEENMALELQYKKGKLAKDALLISENGENTKVCVKQDWQGNTKIYQ
nr:hypothetical protein [uncultured Carboxylicivirga sp.]